MRRAPAVTAIDFETLPIMARPEYPPRPVGVSIRRPQDKKATYYAWGHPTENNCSERDARRALRAVWAEATPLLFFNAKFDVDVAQTHMGCGPIPWQRVHDAMFLVFLHDPHSADIGLKPSAEVILGLAPEERDRVREWVLEHKAQIETVHGYAFTPKHWSGAIGFAPGGLVGPYANGDVDRTLGLFKHLWPRIVDRGMEAAYDRERELMPILLENERVGMRIDLDRLRGDCHVYDAALAAVDVWLRKRLKVGNLNLDNDGEVAEALSTAGIVKDESWSLTATGKRSISKANLLAVHYTDPRVAAAFGYRNRLTTCLKMFMKPWLARADARGDGHINTNWNQVRGTGGGTRTGRPSTNDSNFLNISKTWHDKDDGYVHPAFIKNFVELPLVRSYILPDSGHVFLHRDYNGQELRILGHYEDGALLRAYRENPRMDVHVFVARLIEEITGLVYHRTQVKVTNFRRIYGGGAPATASALNVSIEAAKQLLTAHGKALPGVKNLSRDIKALSAAGDPIITWGGREYFVEPPSFSKKHNRHMTYDYKLLNYLIQGSAADATKQAIINYHNHPERRGRFLVTVYDEINASAPIRLARQEMRVLKECMECLLFDVPMLTDGKTGPNWAELVKYEDAA